MEQTLATFLQSLGLEHLQPELEARRVLAMEALQLVSSHEDLKLLCPSLSADAEVVSLLKLFKAVLAINGSNAPNPRPHETRKRGTAASGEIC